MKIYHFSDFEKNEALLLFRFDVKLDDNFVDLYMLMHLPSGRILAHDIIELDISQKNIDTLLKQAAKHGKIPDRILLTKGDAAEPFLNKLSARFSFKLETVPAISINHMLADIKQSFGSQFPTTSGIGFESHHHDDEIDLATVKKFIPDSYDPCPCASGKKYKFCCKKIFEEITNAMVAAEDGHQHEAIKWIEQAKARVGETSEVLCREAIVYSFFDQNKSVILLEKCLSLYPNHPRAHYIQAIFLVEQADFEGAIREYKAAITNYPETAHYHLNEAYNKLGTIFYKLGRLNDAKSAWEKALIYLPSDKITQQNLQKFIYCDKKSGDYPKSEELH